MTTGREPSKKWNRILLRLAIVLAALVGSLLALALPPQSGHPAHAAPLRQTGTVRFMVTGDDRSGSSDPGGVNTAMVAELAQAAIVDGVDFVLWSGDLVLGLVSTQAELEAQLMNWRNAMQPVYDAGIPVYPIRGNHEVNSNAPWTKTAWDNVFSGTYALPANGPPGEKNVTFSFVYSNVFVVGLDQYSTTYHTVNQAWLDAQFAANTQPHVFVMGHEPAFKVRHFDCLDDYPANRDAFWNSIVAAGGRTYFVGHDHFYDHARIDDGDGNPDNDVHQYVVGTAGSWLHTDGAYNGLNSVWTPQRVLHERQFGYVLVEVTGPDVTITWKHRTAPGVYQATSDVFTYTVAAGSAVLPTATPTHTPLPTATPTGTLLPTATSTHTPLPTATSTTTSLPTATPTGTLLPTATSTHTPLPTATSTTTGTLALTNTPAPTITPLSTATPNHTPSPTATSTPTGTLALTNTPTPTITPTAIQSPSLGIHMFLPLILK